MYSKMFVAVAAALVATGSFAADVKSVSRLAFGPDNILFVADWKGAQVHALALPAPVPKKGEGTFNILDLEALLSKSLGAGKIKVEDMAARPGSGEVYLAVSVGANKTPAIVAVTSDQKVRKLNLASMKSTAVTLKNPNNSKVEFWKETPERSFTVTDMKWNSGELFVAGLSNQDFASTLRRIPYPFTDKQTMTSVEIYHTTHNQIETRAPIRAMSFATLGGKPYVIAAYVCTPLVTIPLEDLKDGAHIKGKAIAELGYGNTPADMISYSAKDPSGKPQDMLMLLNYHRSGNIIPVSEVEAANEKPGIDKPVACRSNRRRAGDASTAGGGHPHRQPRRPVLHRRAPGAGEGCPAVGVVRQGHAVPADRFRLRVRLPAVPLQQQRVPAQVLQACP